MERKKSQSFNRVDVLNKLENVSPGLDPKNLIEQSTSFIFSNGRVSTFNDEIFASAEFDIDFEGAVQSDSLLKILRRVKDEQIEIWEDKKNQELRIKGENFNTGIKYDKEIKLPIDEIEWPAEFITDPNLTEALQLTSLSAGKSLSDSLLTGVHIQGDIVESCDNDRITRYKLDTDLNMDILVPAQNLTRAIKFNLKGITHDEAWAHFLTENDTLISITIFNEEYLNLDQVIPEEGGEKIEFPDELKEVLSRADVFSLQDSGQQEDRFINVQISENELKVSSLNSSGWFTEKSKIEHTGPDIGFGINTDFLKEVIKMTKEIEVIDDLLKIENDRVLHLVELDIEEEE